MRASAQLPTISRILPPAIALVLAVAACAGPLKQLQYRASELSRKPDLTREKLASSQAAILAGIGIERYKDFIGIPLAKALQEFSPDLSIKPPDQTGNIINSSGLGPQYAWMLRNYRETGFLDKDTLHEVSAALGSRYLILPILMDYQQDNSNRITILGIRLARTRTSTLQLMLQIWDGDTGEVVWQGSSEVTLAGEDVREKPISFAEITFMAWRRLVEQLPAAAETDAD